MWIAPASAMENTPEAEKSVNAEPFQAGILQFQRGDFAAAKEQFDLALSQSPNNLAVLVNLALTHEKLGSLGWAAAYLRQALTIQPQFSSAVSAWAVIEPRLPASDAPRTLSLWQSIQSSLLPRISITALLILAAIVFLGTVSTGLACLQAKRLWTQNLEANVESAESSAPSAPWLFYVFSALLIASSVTIAAKLWDGQTPRATIVAKETKVRSFPSADAAEIFSLKEGAEVLVLQAKTTLGSAASTNPESQPKAESEGAQQWFQIQYPGGLAGWVMASEIWKTAALRGD